DFVARRDPLLAGEENRFLKLAPGGAPPPLPETARFVIHETHRVPLARQGAYLAWPKTEGLNILEKQGFRPVGPWTTAVGRWSEVTLLFRFETLAERDRLIARFSSSADGRRYGQQIGELVEDITTRLLLPAPFVKAAGPDEKRTPEAIDSSAILPHLEQVAPRVFAAG